MPETIIIASAKRTPFGNLLGDLSPLTAIELGTTAMRAALQAATIAPEDVTEVTLGNVLSAGLKQAPARQASLGAGIPASVPCTTLNKVCGSGMKAAMIACDAIALRGGIHIAGGMESMSNAPYLLPNARGGNRMGHGQMLDSMFYDGLQNAYGDNEMMGVLAEEMAQAYQFSRAAQDEFALQSLTLAQTATDNGTFADELVPVEITTRKGTHTIASDEQVRKARPEKIPTLRAAFGKDGTITAGNASSISDGAAALVLMGQGEATRRNITPLARILGHSSFAQDPRKFTQSPVGAINLLLAQLGWNVNDVNLWEINEAFAMVPMIAIRDLAIERDKVNVNGGACALGHPIGASGARIIATLAHALKARNLKRGIAAICIGGGEATAIALETI